MNYLSNSTGIYIRLRQHPPLKSCPHLPRIPREALTEVKFLYVNTGNAEGPTCSAIASALVALVCAGEQTGLLCRHFAPCQCPQRSVCFPSPTFSHSWMHHHTYEPEDSFLLSLFQHLHAILPGSHLSWISHLHLHKERLNPVHSPVRKSQRAPQLSVSSLPMGHSREFPGQTPLHPEPKHIRQCPWVPEVQQESPRQHFPWSFSRSAEQGERTKLYVTPPLPWPGAQIFLGTTPYEILPYSHLCLLCTRLANPTKSGNKDGDPFVEGREELHCPKSRAKNAIADWCSHSSPEEPFEGTNHAHPRAPAPLEWVTHHRESSAGLGIVYKSLQELIISLCKLHMEHLKRADFNKLRK